MKKILAIITCVIVITGCQPNQKQNTNETVFEQQKKTEETSAIGVMKIPFIKEFITDDITKILYYDDSQPSGTPSAVYTSVEEFEKILEMLRRIILTKVLSADELAECAPGDFCGYEIYLKNGKKYLVWRSGKIILFNMKRYRYTGNLYRQVHINEVGIYAECSVGYPEDGRINIYISAFDKDKTTISDSVVLKRFDGSRWHVVKPEKPGSGKLIPVSGFPQYIDMKNNYPQVSTGDFKMIYTVYLPDGEKREITTRFTIFNKD